ncbi:YaaR family protein [Metabacillus hrfriensis]|uniref:YaaR family protein n=1 Tax=Metabacillus hrfriensis TaxID=3048891 RepID=A0ACD4RCL1_9BACI|nr:YaaR family protein [Metabacillus sp. CT-WN-B3]UOK58092.1 YaaR family protein [Bacillus sp. OVS6]USK28670.1 YaaR family protein [Bacillus sp. CMF21]WHZ57887.1 YaaR family protein [Metabacillus sp. CT-WN-B3]
MKINQELRTGLDKRNANQKTNAAGSKPFSEMVLRQESKLQLQELNTLMANVEEAGRRVAKSRNMRDLSRYKSLVRRFVQEAVDYGLKVKQSGTWDYSGSTRSLITVEQLDQHLIELTENLLNEDQSSIDILAKIGEIKGLLINLYT